MPTCRACTAYFPNWVKIEGQIRNLCSRKFCLDCSPFGAKKTRKQQDELTRSRRCPRCERTQGISEFYRRRDDKAFSAYCKSCAKEHVVERLQRLKRLGVDYKGGRCTLCGYDRYIGSLEFHHVDPAAKEFNLAHYNSTNFEKIKSELDKCLLLCANCHREEHARLRGLL